MIYSICNASTLIYLQYLRQKKPTGDAVCPPEIKRAHELEELINQRVGTRELSDSEFDDRSDANSSDDDVEVTAVARRAPTPPLRRKARGSGVDLAGTLARAFDPAAQKARDDMRAQRTSENTQIMTVNQQLRDAQAVVEGLRAQNTILQNRVHDLERACDRAELKLEMVQMTQGRGGTRERRRARSPKREPVRCERLYPDGGRMTYWVSAQSTDDDGDDENINPWDTFNDEHSHVVSHRQTPTPGPSRLPASPPPTSSGVRSGSFRFHK